MNKDFDEFIEPLTAELLTAFSARLKENYGMTLKEITDAAYMLRWLSYPKYHPPKDSECIVKIRDGTWNKAGYDGVKWSVKGVVAWKPGPEL